MAAIAIAVLWALFWAIVLAGVVWLVIYGINKFIYALPATLVQGIWFLYLIICIIALITVFAGGGIHIPSFR